MRKFEQSKLYKLHRNHQEASLKDPEIKVYGKMQQIRRGGRIAGTRRTGKAAGFKSNKRQLGAPVLRRDPSAQERLVMIKFVEDKMKDGFVNKPQLIRALQSASSRSSIGALKRMGPKRTF